VLAALRYPWSGISDAPRRGHVEIIVITDCIGDGGRRCRQRSPTDMTAPQTDPTVLTSDVPDIGGVRLDEVVPIDLSALAFIVAGISAVENESDFGDSAFNSSI
jgi:hypothetical protein